MSDRRAQLMRSIEPQTRDLGEGGVARHIFQISHKRLDFLRRSFRVMECFDESDDLGGRGSAG
jgi:hypothetical protein